MFRRHIYDLPRDSRKARQQQSSGLQSPEHSQNQPSCTVSPSSTLKNTPTTMASDMKRMVEYQDACYRSGSTSSIDIKIDGKPHFIEALSTTMEDIEACKEHYQDWLAAQDGDLLHKSLTHANAYELQVLSYVMNEEIKRRELEEPSYKAPKSPFSHPTHPRWGPFTQGQIDAWERTELLGKPIKSPSFSASVTNSGVRKPSRKTPSTKGVSPGIEKLILDMREENKGRRAFMRKHV